VEGLTAAEKNGLSVETEGRVMRKLLHCLGHIADLKTTLQKQSGVQAWFETNPWQTAAAVVVVVVLLLLLILVVVVIVVVIVIMMMMIMIDGDDNDRHYDAVVFTV
jgi:Flp pilus assembly protein TadB